MRAFEGVTAPLVVLECVVRGKKTLDGMTHGASLIHHEMVELPNVRVRVAVAAARKAADLEAAAAAVATLAVRRPVRTSKGEASAVVIKRRTIETQPAIGRVTALARTSQTPLVRVVVAVRAIHEAFDPELDRRARVRRRGADRRVTLAAGDLSVATGKWKPRLGMVESGSRSPSLEIVAGEARIGGDCTAVLVLVTGETLGVEAKVGPLEILPYTQEGARVSDELRPVTGAAPGLAPSRLVRAFERVPGQVVVELSDALITPPDEFKIEPVVLDVARLTGLVSPPGMEAKTRRDPLRDRVVTLETTRAVDPALRVMTIETARTSLKVRMSPTESAGRELRSGSCGSQQTPRADRRSANQEPTQRRAPHRPKPPYPVAIATATWRIMKRYMMTANGL